MKGQKSVKKVIRMGNPILRQVSQQIQLGQIKSAETQQLIQDLKDSMIQYKGLGIAAPQISILKQLCLIQVPQYNQRYGKLKPVPFTVVINPKITILDEQTRGFWQGCLSVPGIRGYVKRPKHIKVTFFNQNAEEITLQLKGIGAIVFQHEVDHLFGVLFVDKAEPKSLTFIEEWNSFELYKNADVIE